MGSPGDTILTVCPSNGSVGVSFAGSEGRPQPAKAASKQPAKVEKRHKVHRFFNCMLQAGLSTIGTTLANALAVRGSRGCGARVHIIPFRSYDERRSLDRRAGRMPAAQVGCRKAQCGASLPY